MGLETLIAAGSIWLFGKYHSKFVDALFSFLKESGVNSADFAKWAKYGWTLAPVKYDQKVRQLYGTISMIGRTGPVPIKGIFTDVFVLDELTAFRRFDIEQLKEMSADPEAMSGAKRLNGLELIKTGKKSTVATKRTFRLFNTKSLQLIKTRTRSTAATKGPTPRRSLFNTTIEERVPNTRLFILGRPGAGKTTFLKYLALKATDGVLDKVPIFVSLKEWDDSDLELMPFLVKQFEICDFPNSDLFVKFILKRGYALVLFDGLDEVRQEAGKRERMIREIRDFSNKYWESQCVITCRLAATDYSFEHFQYVELADFDTAQIDQYVSKWFYDDPPKLALFKEEFGKPENKGLRQLAAQPILLALMCIYFDETLVFAHRQVEVYEKALEVLLTKWDASRLIRRDEIYRGLTLGRKLELFARIAARSFQDNEYFLPQEKLANQIVEYLLQLPDAASRTEIDGAAVLKAIEAQHGLFSERADHIYSFSHLTFQEYFTAKYIVNDNSGQALTNLLSIDFIFNDRWNEVIKFTATLLSSADIFFEKFQKSCLEWTKGHEQLTRLLKWAGEKGGKVSVDGELSVICAVYCLIAIAGDRAATVDRLFETFPDLEPMNTDITALNDAAYGAFMAIQNFVRRFEKAEEGPLARALLALKNELFNIDQYSIQARIGHSSMNQALSFVLAYMTSFIRGPILADDYVLDITLTNLFQVTMLIKRIAKNPVIRVIAPKFRTVILSTRDFCSARGQEALAKELLDLANLTEDQSTDGWRRMENKIVEILQTHRNLIFHWQFSVEDCSVIAKYFKANSLLTDSLAQAVVSDRKAIANSLLLLGTL